MKGYHYLGYCVIILLLLFFFSDDDDDSIEKLIAGTDVLAKASSTPIKVMVLLYNVTY